MRWENFKRVDEKQQIAIAVVHKRTQSKGAPDGVSVRTVTVGNGDTQKEQEVFQTTKYFNVLHIKESFEECARD